MTYFKVDDQLHDHRKSRRARRRPEGGRDAAAIGVWVLAASWSRANSTDGWVPEDELDRWDDQGELQAQRLVEAGLWHRAELDGEPGYRFHEWDEWQHTDSYLNQRRARNAARMRTKRANELAAAQAADQGEQPVRAHSEDTCEDTAHTVSSNLTTATTTTTEKDSPARKRAAAPADKAGEDFAKFWELYPRKTGKQDAARAFIKATKHTDVATIAAGLHNALQVWKSTGVETKFIPHPATWLNRGSWDDEQPLPGAADPQQQARPATAALCESPDCPGTRHEWTDRHGRNRFVCMGVAA